MRTSLEIVIHIRHELRDIAGARDTGAAKVVNEHVTEICEALSDWLVAEHRNSLEIVDYIRERFREMSLAFPVGKEFRASYEMSKELGRIATRLASWMEV